VSSNPENRVVDNPADLVREAGPETSYDVRSHPDVHAGPVRLVGKTRHPWGAWLLVPLTLCIYGFVWYYKVNAEARDYEQTVNVQPSLSVLSLFIPIAGIVSFVRTGGRINQAQRASGSPYRCSGLIGFLLMLVAGVGIVYYQSQLNKVWEQHAKSRVLDGCVMLDGPSAT
jgi:Domain of unknown function (DUF4234)